MSQKHEEWLKVWRDGAAHRDLSYIIGYLKGVNAAFGPVDIYELQEEDQNSRQRNPIERVLSLSFALIRDGVISLERSVEGIAITQQIVEFMRGDNKYRSCSEEYAEKLYEMQAGTYDLIDQLRVLIEQDRTFQAGFSCQRKNTSIFEGLCTRFADLQEQLNRQPVDYSQTSLPTKMASGFRVGDNLEFYILFLFTELADSAKDTAESCIQSARMLMEYRGFAENFFRNKILLVALHIMMAKELDRASFWCGVAAEAQDFQLPDNQSQPLRIGLSQGPVLG